MNLQKLITQNNHEKSKLKSQRVVNILKEEALSIENKHLTRSKSKTHVGLTKNEAELQEKLKEESFLDKEIQEISEELKTIEHEI